MTMEKFGVEEDENTKALRDEEAQLMQKMASFMGRPIKTASEEFQMTQVEQRLGQVRAKLTEIDLKKPKENG